MEGYQWELGNQKRGIPHNTEVAEEAIDAAVNTIQFQTIPLNSKVKDDEDLLTFVNESVKKCNALDPKKSSNATTAKKKPRASARSHHGHDH